MPLYAILFFFLSIALLGLGLLWWLVTSRGKPIQPLLPIPGDYLHLQCQSLAPFREKKFTYDEQPRLWQESMQRLAEQFREHAITQTHFVHGTFAGDDPLDLARMLETAFPVKGPIAAEFLKRSTHSFKDLALQDLGNFSQSYIQLYQESMGERMRAYGFTWSSGNHHIARVRGALEFILYLGSFIEWHPPRETWLIFGHSHAGQLFALLSQMVSNRDWMQELIVPLEGGPLPGGMTTSELNKRVWNIMESIRKKSIIWVTLGTPARYQWMLPNNWQALHLINHRGDSALAPNLLGLPWTKGGDYVQQLGVHGSDFPATMKSDAQANINLDSLLGPGREWRIWQRELKKRNRLHNQGKHLLIDYQDQGRFPNFYRTIMGHGQYTRSTHMLFTLNMVAKHVLKQSGI